MKKTVLALLSTALLATTVAAAEHSQKLDHPHASPEAVRLYDYLLDLTQSRSDSGKLIAGHWLGGSFRPGKSDYPFTMGEVTEIRRHSGKWVGMIDAWICCGEFGTSPGNDPVGDCMWYDHTIADYKLWWLNGGICHIDASFYSPMKDGYWKRFEREVTREVDYDALFTPGTEVNKRWWALCDRMADFFIALQQNDVPVIFRPFTEAYIPVFWYSAKRMGAPRCIELWRQVHDYFTEERGCNNIIWDFQGDLSSPHYPGDDYVDILTTRSEYGRNKKSFGQRVEKNSGMPVGNGELGDYGPNPKAAPGNEHTWREWVEHTARHSPEMSFYITWDRQWGPAQHKNKQTGKYDNYHDEYDAIMNDPYVLTRDELRSMPVPPALPYANDFAAPAPRLIAFRGDWTTGNGRIVRRDDDDAALTLFGGTDWVNYTAQAALKAAPRGCVSLLGRCTSANIFYEARIGDGKLALLRCFEGRFRELASTPFSPRKGERIAVSLTFDGERISATASGAKTPQAAVSAEDDAIPAGCIGLRSDGTQLACTSLRAR